MVNLYKNFFTQQECETILNFVLSNESGWNAYPDSKGTTSLFVYGNSYFRHYLNAKFNTNLAYQHYKSHHNISNDWMYAKLLENIQPILNTKCEYMGEFAKPAFQIITQEPPRVWHYDDEKVKYPYQREFKDYSGFSYFDRVFTMTVMISEGNFSYNYYPETESIYSDNYKNFCDRHAGLLGDNCDCSLKEYQTVNYSVGDLVLTEDRYLHRVGASEYNGTPRVTLQGHIVTKGDTSFLYW